MNNNKIRCHFSIVIENVFSTLWFLIIIAFGEIVSEVNNFRKGYIIGSDLYFMLGLAGIIVISIIINFFMWRKTFVSIDGQSLVIEKNTIILKNNRTIALSSVSNVNLEQNFFERIIGTYKIKLDTNSMSTAESTDVKIVLKKDEADKFKGKLLSIIELKENLQAIDEKSEEIYDIRYSLKEIILHAFYSTPVSLGIYAVIVIACFILDLKENINESYGKDIIGFIIGLGIIIIPLIYSLIKNIFKFYDFKVGRRENKIYISYGLLTKRKYTIPVEKINAVIVDEPTVSRIFKRKNIQLVNIGIGDDNSEGAQLLLSEKNDSYKKKLERLIPEIKIEEKLEKQSNKCIYNYLIYILFHFIFAMILSVVFTPFFMFYMIIPVVYFVLKYITVGLKVNDEYILICSGVFRKSTKYINYKKIQNIVICQGPISRLCNIAKVKIFILSSLVNRVSVTGYYKLEKIEEINRKLT